MNGSSASCMAAMLLIFLLFPFSLHARHIGKLRSRHGHHHATVASRKAVGFVTTQKYWDRRPMMHKRADTLQIAGSSLPDCSHACGSCNPCRLVMVSFVCASLEEAETCPMAYKCMCHNKSYPVP
ncbi:protein EPIDERMAL PATTERNING FACTOR 1 [Coffea arabica]|nr:protein EPIDERMAL PATTERNING FACTOR 1-like [Coffea arabica]